MTSLFKNIYLFIWPRWVLSCGMQDLAVAACGIQLPDQGPLHWERGVSATGPPGKSPQSDLSLTLLSHRVCASLTQCCHTGFLVYACQTLKF